MASQFAAAVKVLPEQLAKRHPVLVDHVAHAPAPLHVPLLEQSPLAGSLALQRDFGSLPPAGTGEQVPSLPFTLQLWHRLPDEASVHAELQHTPSVQKPLAHSVPLVHALPFEALQAPVASQASSPEQLPGTCVPGVARTQVPALPATLHDLHAPVQVADSQHTPSTQLPEEH